MNRLERRLTRNFAKLSFSDKAKVISRFEDKSEDSDSDGVPDFLESSTKRCDSDSDDDGISDGDEYKDGTDPDSDEIEVKGILTATTANSLTVTGITFRVDSKTIFVGEEDEKLSFSNFSVGECIEVEGEKRNGSYIAEEVYKEDDC
jgi:hypothetical protein